MHQSTCSPSLSGMLVCLSISAFLSQRQDSLNPVSSPRTLCLVLQMYVIYFPEGGGQQCEFQTHSTPFFYHFLSSCVTAEGRGLRWSKGSWGAKLKRTHHTQGYLHQAENEPLLQFCTPIASFAPLAHSSPCLRTWDTCFDFSQPYLLKQTESTKLKTPNSMISNSKAHVGTRWGIEDTADHSQVQLVNLGFPFSGL